MSGFFKVESDFISLIAEIGTAATVLYILLLSHGNEDRTCWPSMRRLTAMSGLAMNTVRRSLDVLKAHGLLEIKQRNADNGTCLPNVFYLPPISHPAKFNRVPCQNEQGTLPNLIGGPCQIEQGDPAKTENLTIYRKEINITKRSKAALVFAIPESLNSEPFKAAWGEWLSYRKEKRKPVSERAAKMQLRDLENMGPDRAVAAIRHSIKSDYQGIFEPGGNGKAAADAEPADDLPLLTRRK
jgi:hypothetical protein